VSYLAKKIPFILQVKDLSIGLPKSADKTYAVENVLLKLIIFG
tara:strand:- start:237 stop:365 length:129 start_codon:yes stop_codon:yes gene_type:complete